MGTAVSDLVARVEAMAKRAKSKAEENRARMPTVAAWVDDARRAFGADQVRVIWASEGGVTIGSRQ